MKPNGSKLGKADTGHQLGLPSTSRPDSADTHVTGTVTMEGTGVVVLGSCPSNKNTRTGLAGPHKSEEVLLQWSG